MRTSMHRLQISLPQWQAQFLSERAKRDGVSIAEVVRQLIQREAETSSSQRSVDSLWDIAGIAEDHGQLQEGVPVSERPDLYLAAIAIQTAPAERPRRYSSKTGQKPRK